ncbi:hypothetical protein ONZ45_g6902 [Pleurotus djamor]|nr:hypothetical protein ONZ45_g6902 [Pleurotus djamor]
MPGANPPSSSPTLYDVLGVAQAASTEEIRKAYKRRALKTHPDKLAPSATAVERQIAETEFRVVTQALQVLSDPQRRRRYDQYLINATASSSKPTPQRTPSSPTNTRDSEFSSHQTKLKKEREEWARKAAKEHEERMKTFRGTSHSSNPQNRSQATMEPQVTDPLVKKFLEELRAKNPEWVAREQQVKQVSVAATSSFTWSHC